MGYNSLDYIDRRAACKPWPVLNVAFSCLVHVKFFRAKWGHEFLCDQSSCHRVGGRHRGCLLRIGFAGQGLAGQIDRPAFAW